MHKLFALVVILNAINLSRLDPNAVYSCDLIDRSDRPPTRCETINDIIVEERIHYQSNVRFWCIVLNNIYNYYTGATLEIQLAGSGYGVSFITATELTARGMQVPFQMNTGINRIAIYSYNGQHSFPRIRSIKIAGYELCNEDSLGSNTGEIRIRNRIGDDPDSLILNDNLSNYLYRNREEGDRYRFLNDCNGRPSKNSFTSYCKNFNIPSSVFMIDKLSHDGEQYWCMNFERDKTRRGLKTLLVKFRGVSKSYSWVRIYCIFLF